MSEGKDKKDDKNEGNPGNHNDDDVTVKQKQHRKIEIKVDRDPEITALQKELAEEKAKREAEAKTWEEEKEKLIGEKQVIGEELGEKKAILEKAALEAFEKEKAGIIDICKTSGLTEEQVEEIEGKLTSPRDINTVKTLVNILIASKPKTNGEGGQPAEGEGDKGATKKAPAGKPVFTPPKGAKEYEDVRSMVDGLYKTAYYDPEATLEEKQEAIKKIDKLWDAFIHGKSWKSLRAGGRFPLGQVGQCPRCGEVFMGEPPEKCPKCSQDLTTIGSGV